MKEAVCRWFPVCPMNYYHVQGELTDEQIFPYCKGDWFACERYKMEENGILHPDNMLPDGSIDESLS